MSTYDTAHGVRWRPRVPLCCRGLALDPRPLRTLAEAQQARAALLDALTAKPESSAQ